MKRKILAVTIGFLPPLVYGAILSLKILKPPWTSTEVILATGFIGSYLTGIIVRKNGWFYGMITAFLWDIYFYVLVDIGASIQAGKLMMLSWDLLVYSELITGLLINLLVLGAIGGWLGAWLAKRLIPEEAHPCG